MQRDSGLRATVTWLSLNGASDDDRSRGRGTLEVRINHVPSTDLDLSPIPWVPSSKLIQGDRSLSLCLRYVDAIEILQAVATFGGEIPRQAFSSLGPSKVRQRKWSIDTEQPHIKLGLINSIMCIYSYTRVTQTGPRKCCDLCRAQGHGG